MNNKCKVTVAVISYNPVWEKLRNTLKSIVWQENVDFEIVVADDGSENDCFDLVKEFFKEKEFTNYKLVRNLKNQGIVKNVLSALKVTEGKFIKLISPGDFLYDEDTLCQFVDFAEKNPAAAYFSNMFAYARQKDETIKVFDNIKNPRDLHPWLKNDIQKIKKNYFFYSDYICGATLMFNTKKFNSYLSEISQVAVFAEDMVLIYMIANQETVLYMNVGGIWYEYGEGISTQKSSIWSKCLQEDRKKIIHLVSSKSLLPSWLYTAYFSQCRLERYFLKFIHIPCFYIKNFLLSVRIRGYNSICYDKQTLERVLK